MVEEKKNHRIISYALGALFVCSLIMVSLISVKLVKNYQQNKQARALIERMKDDYETPSKDQKGYYINFSEDGY